MVKLVNRAKVNTPTVGTGTLTLGPAVDGFQSFAAAGVSSGDQVRYVIEDGDAWEIGLGIYAAAGPSLTRGPAESSAAGAPIALSGGAVIFITATTADVVQPGDNITKLSNDAGYTANAGTVTSVAATAGTGISISGSPIAGTGTLTISNTAPHQATNLGITGTGNTRTITSSTGTNVTVPVVSTTTAGLMATGDKSKLDGIAAGAQINVATNLGYAAAASVGTVTSSTGANATLPAATTSAAGLLTSADKSKLDGVDVGAQVNVATNLSVTAGTTAGPALNSSTGTNATLPAASASASGVVTTGDQTFAGTKTFAATISGSISGNAGTATALQTTRSINGTNFNGSSNITTATWGIARTLTIGATGKSVNGSGSVSWTTEEVLPTRLRSHAETITDWNTATANGWYMGSNAANAPGTAWHIGFVEAHNASWTTQTVHAFSSDGPANGLMWRREQNNGIWGSWYRLRWSEDEQDARYAQVNGTGATGTWGISVSGNAGTASALQTTRSINGVNFNGTADITLPTVNTSGNQSIAGIKTFSTAIAISGTSNAAGHFYAGTTNPGNTTRLNYDGNLHVNALTAVGDITAFSDARFKTDIQTIGGALDKLSLIHGVTFRRTGDETQTRYVGLLAQEVEAVLPEAVHTDAQGYKAVAYGNMVALLIEAIKELTARLEKLEG